MRVACARSSDRQASKPRLPGTSFSTSRSRSPATPESESTCICTYFGRKVLARASTQAKATPGKESRGLDTQTEMTGDPRWLALVVLCAGMLMIVLDATIVNVALPSIQSDLGFSQSSLAWVVNAYLIAFGGALLLAGRLGDLLGQRRVFLAGLVVFTAASLVCGLAISQEMLVAARFVQGVGGAMTSAVILGMVVTMFGEPRERARAIG